VRAICSAPLPICTPGMIAAFPPIQISLPITVSPRDGRFVIRSECPAHAPPMIGKGKVEAPSIRWLAPFMKNVVPAPRARGGTYTDQMHPSFTRLTVLVAVVAVVGGCSAAKGDGDSRTPQLQLRIVTSSTEGPCSAPTLTSAGPGSACDRAGTTTYKLAKSLGVVTPRSVRRDAQGESVEADFDKADATRFGDVTGEAVEKQLAVLLDGRVLSATVVKEPITSGKVTFALGTASEAKKVAAELGAATP
jgi:hypothetical protein